MPAYSPLKPSALSISARRWATTAFSFAVSCRTRRSVLSPRYQPVTDDEQQPRTPLGVVNTHRSGNWSRSILLKTQAVQGERCLMRRHQMAESARRCAGPTLSRIDKWPLFRWIVGHCGERLSAFDGEAGRGGGREQPVGVAVGGGGEVEPVADVGEQHPGDGSGDRARWAPSLMLTGAARAEKIVGSQAQDAGQWLCAEHCQQGRDADGQSDNGKRSLPSRPAEPSRTD